MGAIREVPLIKEAFGIATCVDANKCMPYFYEHDGCSVCILSVYRRALFIEKDIRELPNINIPNLLAFLVFFFVVSTVT